LWQAVQLNSLLYPPVRAWGQYANATQTRRTGDNFVKNLLATSWAN
jgi:hypothetical protein